MSKKEQKKSKKEQKRAKKSKKEQKNILFKEKKIKKYLCSYCNKEYKTYANKRRHELHYCKNSKEHIISELKKEKEVLYKHIDSLIKKAGNVTNIQNTQNIQLNTYGKEDLSHITESFKTSLLKGPGWYDTINDSKQCILMKINLKIRIFY